MKKGWRANALLVVISTAIGLLIAEIAVRIFDRAEELIEPVGVTTFRNFARDRLSLFRSAFPSEYDAELGWIPKRNFVRDASSPKGAMTIDARGIRENRPRDSSAPPVEVDPSLPAILVVGDSFAYGYDVGDDESWPAYLEASLHRKVINGGVCGYGFDQTVLRAEKLAGELAPGVIIAQMITADVERTSLSVRTGVAKPYFLIENGRLVLHNVPVPPERPNSEDLGIVRGVLGYSYLADFMMRRLHYDEWWYLGNWASVTAHSKPATVSCMLMQRLGALAATRGVRVIFLMQYEGFVVAAGPQNLKITTAMLNCAREAGLETIDTFPALRATVKPDLEELRSLYRGHMTPKGNKLVADIAAEYLRAHPQSGDHLP